MNYELIIRPEAEEDMNRSYLWYEERREGLGSEFLLSVEATFESISRFPEMYPKVYKHIRRALIRRFPFGVFYFLEKSRIIVIAVYHGKRNPISWQSRLN